MLAINSIRTEHDAAGLPDLYPRPREVQLLEIHVRAFPTHLLCICLDTKQRAFDARALWDVKQHVPARQHQIEPLAVDVLQVWVSRGAGRDTLRAVHRQPRRRSP